MRVRRHAARPGWLVLASCALSVALVLGAGGGAQADAAYWRHCGDQNHPGAGWYNVRGHNIACRNARGVARHWWNSGGDNHFDRWSCTNKPVGEELAIAECKRFRNGKFQRVKFENGA